MLQDDLLVYIDFEFLLTLLGLPSALGTVVVYEELLMCLLLPPAPELSSNILLSTKTNIDMLCSKVHFKLLLFVPSTSMELTPRLMDSQIHNYYPLRITLTSVSGMGFAPS